MSEKLFIIDIGPDALKSAERTSRFSGVHFAKYCYLSTITDKGQSKVNRTLFTGDIISVLRTVLIALKGRPIILGNFKVTLKTNMAVMQDLTTVTLDNINNVIDAEVQGDGINSLVRLPSSNYVAVAHCVASRFGSEADIGCILCDKEAKLTTIGWTKLTKAMLTKTATVHNITLQKDGSILRTNLKNLDKVYLVVPGADVLPKEQVDKNEKLEKAAIPAMPKPEKPVSRDEQIKKTNLLNKLSESNSPLSYVFNENYTLDCMQYILSIHTMGVPTDYMEDPRFNLAQLHALYNAYCEGFDVELIADPRISAKHMSAIVSKTSAGLANAFDIDIARGTVSITEQV